jgi:hypothetical protein
MIFQTVNSYEAFYKVPHLIEFPYAQNLICQLVIHNNWYYASVADGFSFQRSQMSKIWPAYYRKALACFLYGGYSYLMFFSNQTNSTEVIRNRDSKYIKFPKGKFVFDHFAQCLYILQNNKNLYKIDLEFLEQIFTDNSSSSSNSSVEIKNKKIIDFEDTLLDIQITNDQIAYITADNKLLTRKLDGEYLSISESKSKKFSFIPVERIKRDGNYENFRLPPFTITVPKSPILPEGTNERAIWLISLYLIDIVFFIVLLYIIKCTRIYDYKKAIKTTKVEKPLITKA